MAWCLFAAVAQVQPSATPAPAPFDPPTWADRRQVFFKKLFGPQAILETVPGAAFDTARGFPRQRGRGTAGVEKRLASQYGQFVIGEGIEMGVSTIHEEDPRYFRMPDRGFGKRHGPALTSTVIVRGVNGGPTIGLARLADVHGAWAMATTWNPPDQRNPLQIVKYGTLGLSLKAGSNVFREFWPDVKRKLWGH
jgi:hypothetical protein